MRYLLIALTLSLSTAHAGVLDLSTPQAGPFPSVVDLSGELENAFAAVPSKGAGLPNRPAAMPAVSRLKPSSVVVRMSEQPQPGFGTYSFQADFAFHPQPHGSICRNGAW
jgi:hypothetical protein